MTMLYKTVSFSSELSSLLFLFILPFVVWIMIKSFREKDYTNFWYAFGGFGFIAITEFDFYCSDLVQRYFGNSDFLFMCAVLVFDMGVSFASWYSIMKKGSSLGLFSNKFFEAIVALIVVQIIIGSLIYKIFNVSDNLKEKQNIENKAVIEQQVNQENVIDFKAIMRNKK